MRSFAEDLAREHALRRLFAVAAACTSPNPPLRRAKTEHRVREEG